MDTNMEDVVHNVGSGAQPTRLSPVAEPASISTLDGWIESLMTCKQLAEVDVQRLCEKVHTISKVKHGSSMQIQYHISWIPA